MLRSGQEDGSSAFWSSLGKNVDIHKHSWPEKLLDGDETPKSWLVTMQNARRNTHTKTGTTAGTTDTYYHKQHDGDGHDIRQQQFCVFPEPLQNRWKLKQTALR